MMGAEKTLVNVGKGQDPYSVIGDYILNHVTVIEDMIAVIQINGVVTNELYMANVDDDGYFYWKNDWWEGEEDVALLDFFPVSDAERTKWIPCNERLPEKDGIYIVCFGKEQLREDEVQVEIAYWLNDEWQYGFLESYEHRMLKFVIEPLKELSVAAWMKLPDCYQEYERRETEVDQ